MVVPEDAGVLRWQPHDTRLAQRMPQLHGGFPGNDVIVIGIDHKQGAVPKLGSEGERIEQEAVPGGGDIPHPPLRHISKILGIVTVYLVTLSPGTMVTFLYQGTLALPADNLQIAAGDDEDAGLSPVIHGHGGNRRIAPHADAQNSHSASIKFRTILCPVHDLASVYRCCLAQLQPVINARYA